MRSHEMTLATARKLLILSSLIVTACEFLFFILGPALGYPLHQGEAFRMIEIITPVFLGYLGSATRYLFHPAADQIRPSSIQRELLGLLVKGPLLVFSVISAAALFAFGYANRPNGPGMLPDTLGLMLAATLGILTITTSVIVENVFPSVQSAASSTTNAVAVSSSDATEATHLDRRK
jgi:hypothetical protein